jgi:hypothetical protein
MSDSAGRGSHRGASAYALDPEITVVLILNTYDR